MIAKLRGVIENVTKGNCIIDVNGVGYLVFCSSRSLDALPKSPAVATLFIETQVREDAISLYGFASASEQEWFLQLTTVQGVGGRVALNLLSALSPDQLIAAIATQDRAALTRALGVGPKLALRLLTELQERARAGVVLPSGGGPLPAFAAPKGAVADALSALTNLGYRRAEVDAALARAVEDHGQDAALDVLIRAGLKALAK